MPIDDQLAKVFLSSVAEYSAQLQGRRIWLACSGGRDSLTLATLCVQLHQQGELPFLPQLLHVDHGLQTDSHDWAQHVAKWADAQQLPCHILRAQVKGSDEQAARQARYQVMRTHINQGDALLLGHHADDQAETILMRLIQGAGVTGLSGMQPWREQKHRAQRTILWRPWLTVSRATISAYAKRLKLPYIDDPTNESGDNMRSSLRRDIMPTLAHHNANVVTNIARSAQLLNDAQATVSAQAAQDLVQTSMPLLHLSSAQRVLSIPDMHLLPLYRQRQLLHYWLAQDEPLPPSKQLTDDVLTLAQRTDHDHQTQLCWQARKHVYTIRRYRQQLYRLSDTWLTWLALPLTKQMQPLSLSNGFQNSAHQSGTIDISLRVNDRYHWQIKVALAALQQRIGDTDKMTLKIMPLDRQQRIHTALSGRPQAGKKLYQTLGIPLWLRDSLVVVSLVVIDANSNSSTNTEDAVPIEWPIVLLSPFDSWTLKFDKLSIQHIEKDQCTDFMISQLSVTDHL